MNALEDLLAGANGGKVLDVATGDGEFAALLVRQLRNFDTITGIDIDENLLADAHRNLSSRRIRFRRADAAALPFADHSFDMVTMSNALHHMGDPTRVLGEIARVVKPGKPVILQEMVSDGLSPGAQCIADLHEIKATVDRLLGIAHGPTYSREEILAIVNGSPLSIDSVQEYEEELADARSGIRKRVEFILAYIEHVSDHAEVYHRLRHKAMSVQETEVQSMCCEPPEIVILASHRRSDVYRLYSI